MPPGYPGASRVAPYPGQQPGASLGQQPGAYLGQQPGVFPGQPSNYPGQTATYPGQPGAYPGLPGAYPGQSATYPGQPGQYPGQTGQYPGQPNGYLGQPPTSYPAQQWGGYPGRQGYGAYPQGSSPSGQPSLEVSLLETEPYVQQPLLVHLDVISSGNLATASPELAGVDRVLLETVAGPSTSVRGSGREQQIVNRYVIAMTPLRAGSLEIGPLRVTGTLAGGVPFSATAATASRLEVRPVVASVRPWLPLQALQLTRELDETSPLAEGRPITLTLRMQATGGTGAQLPDLEPMLSSDDFRAYREQTIVDTRLSEDGRALQGIRTEIYTLVPYSGGRLQLPELWVDWWNVDSARRERSSVPIRSLSVAGQSGPFGFGRGSGWLGERKTVADDDGSAGSRVGREGSAWGWFWIPVGSILLLLIGYWAGVWYRIKRPAASATGPRARPLIARPLLSRSLLTRFQASLQRLDPRPIVIRLGHWLSARLKTLVPNSMRVYRCAIAAESATSASDWALRFQSSACQSLRSPSREPLPRMADRILRLRPGADGERLRRLIQELDRALYNGAELDLRRWKRELRQALRPGWGAWRGLLGGRLRRARLPALNPSASNAQSGVFRS
jgi:hypothetical protein